MNPEGEKENASVFAGLFGVSFFGVSVVVDVSFSSLVGFELPLSVVAALSLVSFSFVSAALFDSFDEVFAFLVVESVVDLST